VRRNGSALGRKLIAAAKETIAWQRGEIQLETYTLPAPMDVKAIRAKMGMSQAQFAETFALNRRTLQDWECSKGAPLGPVRAYLKVIDKNPAAVIKALRA
jgi:putative transcriptional regulator